MKTVMVRYKVKADRATENEGYITRVYEQLKSEQPGSFRYATFKLEDGVSFVHIASQDAEATNSPLNLLQAFKDFTSQIKERCEEQPVVVEMKEVGSYHFFGG